MFMQLLAAWPTAWARWAFKKQRHGEAKWTNVQTKANNARLSLRSTVKQRPKVKYGYL